MNSRANSPSSTRASSTTSRWPWPGDGATANRAAHSLKGAAATLGAGAVSEPAANCRKRRSGPRDGIDGALAGLELELSPAIWRDTRQALPAEPGGNGAGGRRRSARPSRIRSRRLKHLLETDDGEAAVFIIDAKPLFTGV